MADDQTPPDEFYRGMNFLGHPSSISLTGQETGALAAGGAPVSAPASGSPIGSPSSPTVIGGVSGTGASPGLSPGVRSLLRAAGLAEKVAQIDPGLFTGLGTRGGTGDIATSLSDYLRGGGVDPNLSTGLGEIPGIPITSGEIPTGATGVGEIAGTPIESGGEAVGENVGGAAGGSLGGALTGGAIGAAIPVALGLLTKQPGGEIATNAVIDALGGLLAYETYGLSPLLAMAATELIDPLFAGGQYIPKRQAAVKEASGDLSGVSGALSAAAQSSNPADWLAGLQTQAGNRNAVRSELWLPPDVAQQIGVTGTPRTPGGPVTVEWSQMTPDQFSAFLSMYAANPAQAQQWIKGSGDVGYLPGKQAGQVAASEQSLTTQYLDFLTQQQAQQQQQQQAQPQPATTTAPPLEYPAPAPGAGEVPSYASA
jgi:hypothetical protein